MIRLDDLNAAIAECQGERNPNANTCIKLAAFYTIRNEMFGVPEQTLKGYSGDTETTKKVKIESDSEFAQAANGQPPEKVLNIVDELLDTLYYTDKSLYKAIIRRLKE